MEKENVMKTLIVEDNFTSRLFLQEVLKVYGPCHIAVNGKEAMEAVCSALETGEPYDLVCLDIMMPEMDGQETLKHIRSQEKAWGILSSNGAKVVMTTALDDPKSIDKAFYNLCDAYALKPIDKGKLLDTLRTLKLIK